MVWIESHSTIGAHPKTRKLARLLAISVAQAVGHLHLLWHFAVEYARDGELVPRHDLEDIAAGALWEGAAQDFLTALVESGFVDSTGATHVLHDWHHHGGKAVYAYEDRARAGVLGNHRRWHEARGIVDPECEHCRPSIAPPSGGDSHVIAPPSGGDSHITPPTSQNKQTPPTGEGGGRHAQPHNPKATERVCTNVARALAADGFNTDEIDRALIVLRSRMIAGEEVTSPVGYVKAIATKARAAKSDRRSQCTGCDRCRAGFIEHSDNSVEICYGENDEKAVAR